MTLAIILNGKERSVDPATTLGILIAELKLDGPVAAQINGEIIDRTRFESQTFTAGDVVEIFMMMGGG